MYPVDPGAGQRGERREVRLAIPQLGFVHEDSSNAFVLDIADLVRTTVTVPVAFAVARGCIDNPLLTLEREVRKRQCHAAARRQGPGDRASTSQIGRVEIEWLATETNSRALPQRSRRRRR